MGIDSGEFTASYGWLHRFRRRHSILFRRNQGEAAEIDLEALNAWQQNELREALARYSPEDVFNIDETGLFWKVLPNKTLAFKGYF